MATIDNFGAPDAVRELLKLRSVKDKIAIQHGIELQPATRLALSELIIGGYLRWIDRAIVTELRVDADIYKMTPLGVALCEEEGIEQQ